jgi:VWFA-related protein
MFTRVSSIALALACSAGVLLSAQSPSTPQQPQQQPPQQGESQSFKFRTGVDLINVNATVSDQSGRFVSGLTKDDFRVFDDEQPQAITHFNAERVPVSLGIVLDTSGSMDGDKMYAAKQALERFLMQLLDPEDEVFLYRFDNNPQLVEGWTRDKRRISESLYRIQPRGGTALYDAVTEAVHLAQQGRNKKKAVVIISDGNDTSSRTDVFAVKQLIRESEILVYAIGIDSIGTPYGGAPVPVSWQTGTVPILAQRGQPPRPFPFPIPGIRRPNPPPPPPPTGGGSGGGGSNGRWRNGRSDDRVNVAALRDITDDSGGRTEIIRNPRDLDPATAGIADELSKQYYLGYSASGERDGRWHTIRVEVRNPSFQVRARRGYVAAR